MGRLEDSGSLLRPGGVDKDGGIGVLTNEMQGGENIFSHKNSKNNKNL